MDWAGLAEMTDRNKTARYNKTSTIKKAPKFSLGSLLAMRKYFVRLTGCC